MSVGYIPELSDSRGILFLKDSESGIDTIHTLKGVRHYWNWEKYQIVIDSDRFWDFTGAKSGEERLSKEVYECYN